MQSSTSVKSGVVAKLCSLGFSEDVRLKLIADYVANQGPMPTAKCQCGRLCVARNYGGFWLPETHDEPIKRGPYKVGQFKRRRK